MKTRHDDALWDDDERGEIVVAVANLLLMDRPTSSLTHSILRSSLMQTTVLVLRTVIAS
jgi:hypothetical protein